MDSSPYVGFADPNDIRDFAIGVPVEVQDEHGAIGIGERVEQFVQIPKLFDVGWGRLRDRLLSLLNASFASRVPQMPTSIVDGYVEGDSIHPGRKRSAWIVSRKAGPQPGYHFLLQVIPIVRRMGVGPCDFREHPLVLLDLREKVCLVGRASDRRCRWVL